MLYTCDVNAVTRRLGEFNRPTLIVLQIAREKIDLSNGSGQVFGGEFM